MSDFIEVTSIVIEPPARDGDNQLQMLGHITLSDGSTFEHRCLFDARAIAGLTDEAIQAMGAADIAEAAARQARGGLDDVVVG